MKNSKLPYILFAVGLFLIMGGSFSMYINGLKEDHANVEANGKKVLKNYEKFNKDVIDFENARESLYSSVLESSSYDEYFVNDQSIKQAFLDFENKVNTIQYLVGDLNELCDDSYYSDNSINKKCKDYKLVYEQVNNFFVGDVSTYNKNIETYNDVNENKLETYKTTRDYIDYNKDKEYDGR